MGCHGEGMFVGGLCYADDLALIAPSAHALRRMLQVCSDFASEKNLIFNAGKTQLICFRSHKSVVVDERFEFCGQELTFTDAVVHLGHTLFCDLSDSEDTENKTKDFIRRANCPLANFGVCSPAVKSCLLQFFCTSFYSATLWTLACPELQLLETALNKMLHRIWNFPYCSHRGLTHRLASMQSICNLGFLRSAKLLQAAKLCPSVLVQRAFSVAASFLWSFLGYNCCFGFRHVKVYCNSDNALAGLIREIRNVSLYVPSFQSCELRSLCL